MCWAGAALQNPVDFALKCPEVPSFPFCVGLEGCFPLPWWAHPHIPVTFLVIPHVPGRQTPRTSLTLLSLTITSCNTTDFSVAMSFLGPVLIFGSEVFWASAPTSESGRWNTGAEAAREKAERSKNPTGEESPPSCQSCSLQKAISMIHNCGTPPKHTQIKQGTGCRICWSWKMNDLCQLFKSNPVMWTIRSEEKSIHFSRRRNGK